MQEIFYTFINYSIDNLIETLSQFTKIPIYRLRNKPQVSFFESYFSHLQAQMFIAEIPYIDHDYLSDYADYYVKCFKEYNKKCMRLHFFKKVFSEESFYSFNDNILSKAEINDSYLGFTVIKPLPNTIFGRTCLATYESADRRHYTCKRNYDVNLAGIHLNIESVAYQEQDSVVAACATSALWSVFQVTSRIFNHYLPTPVELTKLALENLPLRNRFFPNNGLNLEQLAQAIRKVNLDPLCIEPTNTSDLKKAIYAYLQVGIPILMGIEIKNLNDGSIIGLHAVSILGYSLKQTKSNFISDDIDELYCHDDQVGCFVRMSFKKKNLMISCGWIRGEKEQEALIKCLLVAQYEKIRIEFSHIYEYVYTLRNIFSIFNWGVNKWDTALMLSNNLKESIIKEPSLPNEKKKALIIKELPKYIWQAIFSIDNKKKISIIFDATGISQDSLIVTDIVYDKDFYNEMIEILNIMQNNSNLSIIISHLIEYFSYQKVIENPDR